MAKVDGEESLVPAHGRAREVQDGEHQHDVGQLLQRDAGNRNSNAWIALSVAMSLASICLMQTQYEVTLTVVNYRLSAVLASASSYMRILRGETAGLQSRGEHAVHTCERSYASVRGVLMTSIRLVSLRAEGSAFTPILSTALDLL